MSEDAESSVQLRFTGLFKRRLKGLAKRYRQIQTDIQPILDPLALGNFVGDQIAGTRYTVYKVRARNSDTQVGKSAGYRLIYQVESPSKITFHLIYAKSEQTTVTAAEIQGMIEAYQKEIDG